MPKKKLTLSVDEAIVERAKRFSLQNQTTVSRLVTDILASLETEAGSTPVVTRLRGILPSTASRDEYRAHRPAEDRPSSGSG
jgi:hypothetical protein